MSQEDMRKFSANGLEMEIEGEWFRVKLTTRAGRHAARMWAYTIVSEGPENDGLAKVVLDYVTREELINAE